MRSRISRFEIGETTGKFHGPGLTMKSKLAHGNNFICLCFLARLNLFDIAKFGDSELNHGVLRGIKPPGASKMLIS